MEGRASIGDRLEPHRQLLRRYALRLVGDPNDAEDLVHDTLTRALEYQSKLPDDPEGVGPWLAVTLYRLFVDRCRRRAAESKAYEGIRHIMSASTAARPEPLPQWMTVSDDAHREAIRALPEKLQAPYALRAKGLSYSEIAAKLDIGINTVSTYIRRARRCLKSELEKETL